MSKKKDTAKADGGAASVETVKPAADEKTTPKPEPKDDEKSGASPVTDAKAPSAVANDKLTGERKSGSFTYPDIDSMLKQLQENKTKAAAVVAEARAKDKGLVDEYQKIIDGELFETLSRFVDPLGTFRIVTDPLADFKREQERLTNQLKSVGRKTEILQTLFPGDSEEAKQKRSLFVKGMRQQANDLFPVPNRRQKIHVYVVGL